MVLVVVVVSGLEAEDEDSSRATAKMFSRRLIRVVERAVIRAFGVELLLVSCLLVNWVS